VSRLADLRLSAETAETFASTLYEEWGSFGLLGFDNLEQMFVECGDTIFVAHEQGEYGPSPLAVLQTTLLNVGGDPKRLAALFPSFADLTSVDALRQAAHSGGDTAVLLQITVIHEGMRRGGLGSLLRDTALDMLDRSVNYALTTTPVDPGTDNAEISLDDATSFTAAMRFHARGGAEPTIFLPASSGLPMTRNPDTQATSWLCGTSAILKVAGARTHLPRGMAKEHRAVGMCRFDPTSRASNVQRCSTNELNVWSSEWR
jgi:hypothetical protein